MSYSISTLLTRNLHDVFGENDGTRRRAAIDEIYTEYCVFYDPTKGVYRGRDEIDRIAGETEAGSGSAKVFVRDGSTAKRGDSRQLSERAS